MKYLRSNLKYILPIAAGVVAVLAVAALWYYSLLANGDNTDDNGNIVAAAENINSNYIETGEPPGDNESHDDYVIDSISWDGIEKLIAEYQEDVTVIVNAPAYSIVESNGLYIVTIHNPTSKLRQLSVGEKFVLEPTGSNPRGLAGYVESIVSDDTLLVMTVRLPEALDEIFEEFEFVADIDMLAGAVEIPLSDQLYGVDGVEIGRNPTRRVWLDANNADLGGVKISGRVEMITPRISASLSRSHVDYLILTTGVLIDIKADAELKYDRLFHLFTIPVSLPKGIHIDILVGILIHASGEVELTLNCRMEAQFGYKSGEEFRDNIRVTPTFNGTGEFNAKIELSANMQARASVMLFPIYGIEGTLGKGVRTDAQMQQECTTRECFVVGTYNIRIINSADWGIFKFLKWQRPLQGSGALTGHWFITQNDWLTNCPHKENEDEADSSDNQPPDNLPTDAPPPDLPQNPPANTQRSNTFGTPVTLEVATRRPGVYIKSDDMFSLILPQWIIDFNIESAVAKILFPGMSDKLAVLFDPDFEVPKISTDTQLVLIGLSRVDIFETLDSGWTIPYGVDLGVQSSHWIDTGTVSRSLLDYRTGGFGSNNNQQFDTINGNDPLDFVNRMVYTRRSWNLMRFNGILSGEKDEEFTFAWGSTTRTLTADRQFFTLDNDNRTSPIPKYFIVITDNGYHEIDFFETPTGYFSIKEQGRTRIVEFVEP
ncbi:MAG: hypothetical protein FWD44_02825 [Oscillospiraceae bacterium]|nr:hypothetical protein [Oscillospiraceae bacterium]